MNGKWENVLINSPFLLSLWGQGQDVTDIPWLLPETCQSRKENSIFWESLVSAVIVTYLPSKATACSSSASLLWRSFLEPKAIRLSNLTRGYKKQKQKNQTGCEQQAWCTQKVAPHPQHTGHESH